jgi:hypothetical protein
MHSARYSCRERDLTYSRKRYTVFANNLIVATLLAFYSPVDITPTMAAALDARTVCGTPNEEVSQETKGNLEGKAQTLARIGTAELQGAVSNVKREIEVRENRGDAARELHYLNYISCVLIYQDDRLSTDDKLKRVNVIRESLKSAPAPNGPGTETKQTEPPVRPTIAGRWPDNWGTVYDVVQEGDAFKFSASGTSCRGSYFQSSGHGTITERNVRSSYASTIPSGGECTGTVFGNGTQMSSTCSDTACGAFSASLIRQR